MSYNSLAKLAASEEIDYRATDAHESPAKCVNFVKLSRFFPPH
jgi:hypothetical protein